MYWIFFIWYKLDAILKTKMIFRLNYYVDSKRVRGIRFSRNFREFYSFFISKNHCFHVWCASKVLWKSYSKNMCHFVYPSKQSQETDSLQTRAVLIEIFMVCWNLSSGSKHRDDFKKNIAFPEGNKQFAGNFVLIWMK